MDIKNRWNRIYQDYSRMYFPSDNLKRLRGNDVGSTYELDLSEQTDIEDVINAEIHYHGHYVKSLTYSYNQKNKILTIHGVQDTGESIIIDFTWSKQKLRELYLEELL